MTAAKQAIVYARLRPLKIVPIEQRLANTTASADQTNDFIKQYSPEFEQSVLEF